MKTLMSVMLLLLVAAPAASQEREIRDANLPRALETRLLRLYESAADRYEGAVTIEAGRQVRGDIAAVGGPLHIAGAVVGDVAMVGGDVVLEPGGSVSGDVTVVGGQVRMADDAVVAGAITAYGAAPGSWRRPRRADRDPADDDDDWRRRDRDRRYGDRGHSRLSVRAGVSYNRVEGLPVLFGPVIETAGATPLRLEAFAIWRTEMGASLDGDRMGYQVRAEQFLTGTRAASLGATVYSVVDPMDRWQLRDLEASLAAVLFHEDYRDHLERTGWSAFARVRPTPGLDARITYRDERHGAVPVGDPWALFNRSDAWRLQPLVAEGTIRTLGASVELDRRSPRVRRDGDGVRSGWLARASIERPVGGALVRPAMGAVLPGDDEDPAPAVIPATPMDTDFTVGLLDVRRYNPVGYDDGLHFRVVAGGSLTDTPLPPQYQHALGGPGTIPGFTTFHGDCGARRATGSHDDQRYFPAYGCDRFALGQVEYRGRLSLDFGFGDWHKEDHRHRWWDDVYIDASPTWVVFLDAGRGWASADPLLADGATRDTGTMVDAGLGILFGRLGVYAALPLNSDVEQKPRFMLRWGPRF